MYTKESAKMASFRSVDELNDAIRTHIYRNKSDLMPAVIEVLKVLSRHACKTPGVAYLKLLKIVSQLEGDDDDYVFASRKGGKTITRVQAYRILNDTAKRAGIYDKIGGIGTHTLRKTFGYRLYENGVDVSRIMSILNHSSERDTLKYIGITADEIEAAYESIEV
ncbi:tyrosine-type recombinase/integrase [Bacillus sp. HSf4]|uniref:tyrosine-type recombinase/integrase n=1 Tax=Bacillus sp. HSf4 TaxID=3035514 RepID=UPI00321A9707